MSDREQVYKFYEIIQMIKSADEKDMPLSNYMPGEIASAINTLIDYRVQKERRACAQIAEDAADASGTVERGTVLEPNPIQKQTALEIASQIRSRR
jgi:hypothetical protein